MSGLNWYLRGGFSRLVAWDPATGVAVNTPMVRSGADMLDDKETQPYTDGSSRQTAVRDEFSAAVASWPDVKQLRDWEAAGTEIRAVLVALGRGPHRQWDEAAVPLMTRLPSSFGALTGGLLRLQAAAIDAAVYDSPDLLEPFASAAWDGSEDRAFPAVGVTVYSWVPGSDHLPTTDVTLTALTFGGEVLATAGPSSEPSMTLPAGTYKVRVTSAGGRPILVTRPSARPLNYALVDTGLVALVDSDDDALIA